MEVHEAIITGAMVIWGEYSKCSPSKGVSRPLLLSHMNILFVVTLKIVELNFINNIGKEIPRIWGAGGRNRA